MPPGYGGIFFAGAASYELTIVSGIFSYDWEH
jgi:hypothetical protein